MSLNGNSSNQHQIEVHNLWKVFGPDPYRALNEEYRSMTRTEIQEELGS